MKTQINTQNSLENRGLTHFIFLKKDKTYKSRLEFLCKITIFFIVLQYSKILIFIDTYKWL